MSSIAVFLVLGGATAFAAGLAKNSVGSKQLKKNAVTSAKIKKNAVTTAKIKNGAVTGAKVNAATLGVVPNATHATNADNAVNAGNANTVGGHSVNKVFAKIAINSSTTVGTFGTFKIVASCDGAGNVTIEADPQSEDSDYAVFGNGQPGGPFFAREQGAEDNAEEISGGNDRGSLTFSGAQSNGAVVTGTLGWDDTDSFNNEEVCAVYGYFIV
ncbi:MAG TPA: hypothetical protein VFR75_07000 [Solirubrobacterales bacterium]|nr:hypothetical protein [Solirubrobacterales bacterium]